MIANLNFCFEFLHSVHVVHFLHFLDHAWIVIVVPLGQIDPLLHLFQSLFEHLGKFSRHFFDLFLQVQNFSFFGLELFILFLFCCRDCFVILFELFLPFVNFLNQIGQFVIVLLLHLFVLVSHSCCNGNHFLFFSLEITL